MTPKEAEEHYGKEMLKKMRDTGWLDGITATMNEKGEVDIPNSDYERAFRAAKREKIGAFEWD